MRWNLSSRARELADADAIVLSVPKSGRTWLRTFISSYYASKTGQPFSLELTRNRQAGIPRIVYSHDRFEHRSKGDAWDRLRGKYLVPEKDLQRARLLLLMRDPRDAFVSYFVQMTRRNPDAPDELKKMSADEMLRDPRVGIAAMVETINHWFKKFANHPRFQFVRYEDLRADPRTFLAKALQAIGESEIASEPFEHALQFSSFEHMQQLEASGAFGSKILRPLDASDLETFKVRKGEVGGFRAYLSPESQRFAAQIVGQLDPPLSYR